MKRYIYTALKKDDRYNPPKYESIEFSTEAETIQWLQENGGGIYRNILHNFDCIIKPKGGEK